MRPALSFLVGLLALFGACFAPPVIAWTTSVSLPTASRHAISPRRRATVTAATAAPAQPVIQKERVLKRAPNSKLMLFDDPVRSLPPPCGVDSQNGQTRCHAMPTNFCPRSWTADP